MEVNKLVRSVYQDQKSKAFNKVFEYTSEVLHDIWVIGARAIAKSIVPNLRSGDRARLSY